MAITRLGSYGGPRSAYGDFAGKNAAPVVIAAIQFGKKFYKVPSKKTSTIQELERQYEEFELMAIIRIIGHYLL